jgi:hypothetical protein
MLKEEEEKVHNMSCSKKKMEKAGPTEKAVHVPIPAQVQQLWQEAVTSTVLRPVMKPDILPAVPVAAAVPATVIATASVGLLVEERSLSSRLQSMQAQSDSRLTRAEHRPSLPASTLLLCLLPAPRCTCLVAVEDVSMMEMVNGLDGMRMRMRMMRKSTATLMMMRQVMTAEAMGTSILTLAEQVHRPSF